MLQREGLTHEYRTDLNVRNLIRRIFALPFLPVEDVIAGYDEVLRLPSTVIAVFDYPALLGFIDYIRNTWLDGIYPLRLWNVHDAGRIKTNNNIFRRI